MAATFQSRLGGEAEETYGFNPNRLVLARKRRGLKQAELADDLKLTSRTLIAYEGGHCPPFETLARIAQRLDFPVEFFAGEDIDELDVLAVSFRSLSKMSARHRDMAINQGNLAVHVARWMDKRFELPACDLPDLSQEANPEVAADYVRQHWGIGQLPIRNMIHLLEAKGVRVFSISIEAREVDAFSTWKDGIPYVFLNTYKSAEHSRFDAAHELGHLVMHKHGAPLGRQAELDANKFASAFLMPRGSVQANAPRFATIAELRRLKKIWGVSLAALNTRLHDVELVSDWHYTGLCIEIGKRGFRTSEPDAMPRETSQVLPQLFASLYQHDGMTRSRVAQELGLSLSELESLLFSLTMTSMNGGGKPQTKRPGNPALLRVK